VPKTRTTAKLAITNPDKVLYPAGRFTKQQVVEYYLHVARWLLPHFKNRPITLKRFPEGVRGEFFYEKDAPSFTPAWVKTFPVPRREGGSPIDYILINDAQTLAWTANMAALELHPFLHRVPKIEQPTAVVFDLDPGEGADVLNCCEVALLLRDVFDGLRLKSFAKVSGSKGIQVYVPLNTPVTYDVTQPFARTVAELLEREHPKLVVADMSKNLRVGKVFIDWSQNADHKTTVGVYSLRAKRDRPYISMPVKWGEIDRALANKNSDDLYFTPGTALNRLVKVGDLFASVLKLKQKVPAAFRIAPSANMKKSRALTEYNAKRNFTTTREPALRRAETCGLAPALRFSARDARRVEIMGGATRRAVEIGRDPQRVRNGRSPARLPAVRGDHP
jgi:bifunctional non-homologous end joining protein LigD